ncbi:alpha-hydroxy acid oxidase [Wenzhouxiangella sp. XN24]|uniref:alpha-hydroxy acid oxidase n=1 Tax=Wenzhouxiangella sp. XN24 TaxID=2713569 RepID=UPI00197E81FA|nr:alpha-hydroxy acid oxidase [Wenzhouxiangella sp. XN24]
MDNPARRQLLKFLAASPLLYCTAAGRLLAEESLDAIELPDYLIGSPADALDVFDFHAVAKHTLPPAHYGYLATGTDGNETLTANRRAFEQVYLRPSRMVDTSRISLETTLLGESLQSPIVLAPVGSQGAFHPDAELATARAARAQGHLQLLSNVATTPIEDVMAARGEPVWFQFYPTNQWSTAQMMLERAERAGARVVVLTVDLNSGSNRVLLGQHVRTDDRDCTTCHGTGSVEDFLRMNPMYQGSRATYANFAMADMTWDYLDRIRGATSMKIVVKGIVTREDAASAVEAGADAVYVSNHGGRAEASGWGALESLPEVVETVNGRVPVMIDSGFRRGTDIFKALALGADAVCIGRPYIWGLAAFGQAGVEKVLEMLKAELAMVMGQVGAVSIEDISRRHVGVR